MSGPSNDRWLRKWLRLEPHIYIGGKDDPYLLRWYLLPRNRFLNLYVHKFVRSDVDTLHDHPWGFVSLILRGEYTEVTPQGHNRRRAGSLAFRDAKFRHHVVLLPELQETARLEPTGPDRPLVRFWHTHERPCWTLIATGPVTRVWGFWCPTPRDSINSALGDIGVPEPAMRFVPHHEFADAGCGEA
ncbi:hypothetical protein [Mycolicibacterium fortuitum]|uniref:hypothetical protein n=1 Tax=Mycolicibacterium fortuitum TaxID=1766 RepID=UPI0007EBFADB|nr:hypothetical protein [Mycolicibacterium fortuitum]OBF77036.1 hypothetical protein A5751_22920 [Mycolicibacterium fortuitum]